jgi:hypothetical protein
MGGGREVLAEYLHRLHIYIHTHTQVLAEYAHRLHIYIHTHMYIHIYTSLGHVNTRLTSCGQIGVRHRRTEGGESTRDQYGRRTEGGESTRDQYGRR